VRESLHKKFPSDLKRLLRLCRCCNISGRQCGTLLFRLVVFIVTVWGVTSITESGRYIKRCSMTSAAQMVPCRTPRLDIEGDTIFPAMPTSWCFASFPHDYRRGVCRVKVLARKLFYCGSKDAGFFSNFISVQKIGAGWHFVPGRIVSRTICVVRLSQKTCEDVREYLSCMVYTPGHRIQTSFLLHRYLRT
jgi:hypothetical protein